MKHLASSVSVKRSPSISLRILSHVGLPKVDLLFVLRCPKQVFLCSRTDKNDKNGNKLFHTLALLLALLFQKPLDNAANISNELLCSPMVASPVVRLLAEPLLLLREVLAVVLLVEREGNRDVAKATPDLLVVRVSAQLLLSQLLVQL